jgi:adenine-specific DNA-methyltransferase
VCHYAKTILDEVFGYENFRNEIVWKRKTGTANSKNVFGVQTESLFFYSKTDDYKYERQYRKEGVKDEEIGEKFNLIDDKGRNYWSGDLGSPNPRPNLTYDYKGYKPPKNGWAISIELMKKWDEDGKLIFPKEKNGRIRRKMYLDDWQGFEVQNLWDDISPVQPQSKERVDYKTQKPEKLLERILKTSSIEGDLVMDCFCGSGTTAAVSEKLNRKWITCDLGRFSIHTSRKRLLGTENVKPFIVQNLGKYERQQWMNAEFENPENRIQQEKAYKHFIIELYQAKSLNGYTWLHGAKAGRMVHVGSVEAPVAIEDIKSAIKEFWQLIGKEKSLQTNGIDFLGWDFAFDVNETAKQFAAENKVDVSFKKIPREVLEKKAVEQGDIKFYELASLTIKTKITNKKLDVTLDNFIIPPDDVPQEVQGKITHWSQWIDYWAVDWNYRDDTFHNEWQSYRTKKEPKIDLTVARLYETTAKYTVLIKVIDILGNDTTKVLHIDI